MKDSEDSMATGSVSRRDLLARASGVVGASMVWGAAQSRAAPQEIADLSFEVIFGRDALNQLESIGPDPATAPRWVNQQEGMLEPQVEGGPGGFIGTIGWVNGNLAAQTLRGTRSFSMDGQVAPPLPANQSFFAPWHPNGTYPGPAVHVALQLWVTRTNPTAFTTEAEFRTAGVLFLTHVLKVPTEEGSTVHLPISAMVGYTPPFQPFWLASRVAVRVGTEVVDLAQDVRALVL